MSWFSKIAPSLRVSSLMFITVVVIASLFCYYYFAFIPENKQRLIERNFRALDQIAVNVQKKKENTAKSLINNIKNVLEEEYKKSGRLNPAPEELEKVLKLDWGTFFRLELFQNDEWIWYWENKHEISSYSYFGKDHLQFDLYFTTKNGQHYRAGVFGALSDFFDFAQENSDFEDFILVSDHRVYHSTFSGDILIKEYVTQEGKEKVDEKHKLDTRPTIEQQVFSKMVYSHEVIEANIGGVKKYLFTTPTNFIQENSNDKSPEMSQYIGVVDFAEFQSEALRISSLVIIVIIMMIIGIALSIPFLKIQLISKEERLNSRDLVLLGLSLILACCIVTLGLFNGFNYETVDQPNNAARLVRLSQSLMSSFQQEVTSAINLLEYADQHLDKNSFGLRDNFKPKELLGDLEYSQLYWINKEGEQIAKWSSGLTSPLINVSGRVYFKRIIANNSWSIKGSTSPYYLESVFSSNSGKATTAISIPSKSDFKPARDSIVSVALTMDLKSLSDVTLPKGFQYVVIDEAGMTLYHTDKSKLLRENFIEECDKKENLRAIIKTNSNEQLEIKYRGQQYETYIKPLEGTEYYLITMVETGFHQTLNSQVIILTFWLVIGLCAFNFLMFFLQRLATMEFSRLKYRSLSYHWLRPLPIGSSQYLGISFCYLIMIGAMIGLHREDQPFTNAFMFLIASVMAFLIGNVKIKQASNPNQSRDIKIRGLIVPVFLLVFLNSIALLADIIDFQLIVFFQLIIGVAWLLSNLFENRWRFNHRYQPLYALYVTLWLFIIAVLPTIKMYEFAYELEQKLALKYRQLELAEKLIGTKDHASQMDFYLDTRLIETIPEGSESDEKFETIAGILSLIKPSINELTTYTKLVSGSNQTAGLWYNDQENEYLILQINKPNGQKLTMSSLLPSYQFPTLFATDRSSFFWQIFTILFVLLYFLVLTVAKRVFILKALGHQPLSRAQISKLVNESDHPYILLIGLPGAGKKTFINNVLSDSPTLIKVSDISCDEDIERHLKTLDNAQSVCLLDDLEYDLADVKEKEATLKFLEKLLSQNPKKIIVSSAISPLKYLEHLDASNESEIDRWSAVFGRFYLIYFPIPNTLENVDNSDELTRVVYEECRHGNYLQKLYAPVLSWAHENKPKLASDMRHFKEEIILEIQSMAEQYYKSIWRQCTDEEKYVLYDMAEDNLVNPQNVKIVNELIARGLVKNDRNVLEVMNQSFRNYIMTNIPKQEALELELNIKKSGSWQQFKGPLVFLLLALSVFMFVTQDGALNTAISAITATLSGLAGLQNQLNNVIPQRKKP